MVDKITKKIGENKIGKKKFTWADFDRREFYKETAAIRDIFIKKEREKYGNSVCKYGESV